MSEEENPFEDKGDDVSNNYHLLRFEANLRERLISEGVTRGLEFALLLFAIHCTCIGAHILSRRSCVYLNENPQLPQITLHHLLDRQNMKKPDDGRFHELAETIAEIMDAQKEDYKTPQSYYVIMHFAQKPKDVDNRSLLTRMLHAVSQDIHLIREEKAIL